MSDQLAKQGANKNTPDNISLEIPAKFDPQEAKLAKITQATAYRGIQENKRKKQRNSTTLNLEKVRSDIELYMSRRPARPLYPRLTHKQRASYGHAQGLSDWRLVI